MAVMADQVGADVVAGDRRGLLGRRTGREQQALGDLDQAFGWTRSAWSFSSAYFAEQQGGEAPALSTPRAYGVACAHR